MWDAITLFMLEMNGDPGWGKTVYNLPLNRFPKHSPGESDGDSQASSESYPKTSDDNLWRKCVPDNLKEILDAESPLEPTPQIPIEKEEQNVSRSLLEDARKVYTQLVEGGFHFVWAWEFSFHD